VRNLRAGDLVIVELTREEKSRWRRFYGRTAPTTVVAEFCEYRVGGRSAVLYAPTWHRFAVLCRRFKPYDGDRLPDGE
jgi:hypothetical protein